MLDTKSSHVKKPYMNLDDTNLLDPAQREQLAKDLEQAIKDPKQLADALKKQAAAAENNTKKFRAAEKLAKWKKESWLFKFSNAVSGWFLLSLILLLLIWAKQMIDPLSHLIGYHLIVTDIAVIDGDTFRAKIFPERIEAKFRLRLVDAPELRQPFGYEASEILADIFSGGATSTPQQHREVIISVIGPDEKGGGFYYCDALVRDSIFMNVSSVQKLLVERGAAWAHRGFHSAARPSAMVVAMERAQKDGVGLWKIKNPPPQAPWEFVRNGGMNGASNAAASAETGGEDGHKKKKKRNKKVR